MAKLAAAAPIFGAIGAVTSVLGLMNKPKAPVIPKAQVPAAPAPIRRSDTGASVALGTSANIKNQRVSGRSNGGGGSNGDPLGGLGRGGLNI